jgi:hypothetical protein
MEVNMSELCGCGAKVVNDCCVEPMRHSYYLVGKLEAKNEEIERLKLFVRRVIEIPEDAEHGATGQLCTLQYEAQEILHGI